MKRNCDLTRAYLEAESSGTPVDAELLTALERHLESCRICTALLAAGGRLAEILKGHLPSGTPSARPGTTQPGRTPHQLGSLFAHGVRGQLDDVEERLSELRALEPGDRLAAVSEAPDRFRTPLIPMALLASSRAALPDRPEESRSWAEVAELVLRQDARPDPAQLARAIAYRGNADRATGDLPRAHTTLLQAQALLLEDDGSVYALEAAAEVHSFMGSLLTDLRRFDEALDHLHAAARIYHDETRNLDLARVQMKISNVHTYRGDPHEALKADYDALVHLNRDAHPRLYLAARFNLAYDLVEAGRITEAVDHLHYDEDLYHHYADRSLATRLIWLSGRIATELRHFDEAVSLLRRAFDAFAEAEIGFDAALVALDLALLYLREGRAEDARAAARLAYDVFTSCEVHPEAVAALRLLVASTPDATSEAGIRRTIRFLQAVSRPPAHQHQTAN